MMGTQCLLGLRTFVAFAAKLWSFFIYPLRRQIRTVIQYKTVRCDILPLSPVSRNRLSQVKRKILVLDLDETLIHYHHDGVLGPTVRPGTPPDFILKVVMDKHPDRFFVHKRPHVDFFLEAGLTGAIQTMPSPSKPRDTALLNQIPMLDALRFTADVRSVLSRNLHQHRLW
ncbi:hypothetical protein CapIbe_015980 [Capra ibex]